MKQGLLKKLGGLAVALLMPAVTWAADFENFSVIVNNQSGTILTSGEMAAQGNAVSFGVAVSGGIVSRVATDAANSIATITGNYHSEHGMTNFQCVVAVPGNVKITLGNCTYGGHTASYQPEGGEKVNFSTAESCWKNNHSDVTEVYYTGGATTLTIIGAGYTPYFAIESSAYVPDNKTLTFSIGESGATGVVPAAVVQDIKVSTAFTIPTNFTLYKDGYTLTGWNDGTATYAVGAAYTITDDVTFTPVFTANTVTLDDRTEATTIYWEFRKNAGVPQVGWEGNNGFLVGQATIGGSKIDVKLDINATSGKFNNSNGDWAQVNKGTTFTLPSAVGATITAYSMSEPIDGSDKSTLDGNDYASYASYTASYVATSTSGTSTLQIKGGNWYRYIQAVLPVVVNLTEEATSYTPVATTGATVALTRTLSASYYNTFCVPFEIDLTDASCPLYGADVQEFTAMDGNTLKFTAVTTTMGAGNPYLVKPAADVVNPVFTGVTVVAGAPATATVNNGTYDFKFKGTYTTVTLATDKTEQFLNTSGTFSYPSDAGHATMKGLRGYFIIPSEVLVGGAPEISISFDGDEEDVADDNTTVIDGIEYKTVKGGEFYNLNGQRVAQPTKGLYIMNGKKYVVK